MVSRGSCQVKRTTRQPSAVSAASLARSCSKAALVRCVSQPSVSTIRRCVGQQKSGSRRGWSGAARDSFTMGSGSPASRTSARNQASSSLRVHFGSSREVARGHGTDAGGCPAPLPGSARRSHRGGPPSSAASPSGPPHSYGSAPRRPRTPAPPPSAAPRAAAPRGPRHTRPGATAAAAPRARDAEPRAHPTPARAAAPTTPPRTAAPPTRLRPHRGVCRLPDS